MPIATGIVGDDGMGAVLAARDVAAQRRRAAALDRRHHLQLVEADMAGVGLAPCRTMATENIRNLRSRVQHPHRSARCLNLLELDRDVL